MLQEALVNLKASREGRWRRLWGSRGPEGIHKRLRAVGCKRVWTQREEGPRPCLSDSRSLSIHPRAISLSFQGRTLPAHTLDCNSKDVFRMPIINALWVDFYPIHDCL